MEVLITRQRDGRYMITHPKYPPIIERVYGTRHTECYVRPGDPVGLKGVCDLPVRLMKQELKQFESLRAEVSLRFIERVKK